MTPPRETHRELQLSLRTVEGKNEADLVLAAGTDMSALGIGFVVGTQVRIATFTGDSPDHAFLNGMEQIADRLRELLT